MKGVTATSSSGGLRVYSVSITSIFPAHGVNSLIMGCENGIIIVRDLEEDGADVTFTATHEGQARDKYMAINWAAVFRLRNNALQLISQNLRGALFLWTLEERDIHSGCTKTGLLPDSWIEGTSVLEKPFAEPIFSQSGDHLWGVACVQEEGGTSLHYHALPGNRDVGVNTYDLATSKGSSSMLMGLTSVVAGTIRAIVALFEDCVECVELTSEEVFSEKYFLTELVQINGTATTIASCRNRLFVGSSQGDICALRFDGKKLECVKRVSIPRALRLKVTEDLSGIFQCINHMVKASQDDRKLYVQLWNGLVVELTTGELQLGKKVHCGGPSPTYASSFCVDDKSGSLYVAYGSRGQDIVHVWN